MFSSILKSFIHIFFPVECAVCGRAAEVVCRECLASIRENLPAVCFDCGLVAPCPIHNNSPWIYSFSNHADNARKLVLALKYGGNEALGRAMGAQMSLALAELLSRDMLIVPLPLHLESRRSFNQARAISEGMSRVLGLKIVDALSWTRHIEGQTGKSKLERHALPNDAFSADKIISGRKIVIVDDVCTTGTTLRRAAEACSNAGGKVIGLTVWAKSKQ